MRARGRGVVWGVTASWGPRFVVSRCVDRGPGEQDRTCILWRTWEGRYSFQCDDSR